MNLRSACCAAAFAAAFEPQAIFKLGFALKTCRNDAVFAACRIVPLDLRFRGTNYLLETS
jgi:hypothetical protein